MDKPYSHMHHNFHALYCCLYELTRIEMLRRHECIRLPRAPPTPRSFYDTSPTFEGSEIEISIVRLIIKFRKLNSPVNQAMDRLPDFAACVTIC